jgi:hypothetical protein
VEAELTALADEATAIATSGIANGTQIARTVQAAETSAANLQGINRQLVVTLRALIPPTQQIVTLSGAVTPGYNEPLPGQTPVAVGPTAPTPPGLPAAPFSYGHHLRPGRSRRIIIRLPSPVQDELFRAFVRSRSSPGAQY